MADDPINCTWPDCPCDGFTVRQLCVPPGDQTATVPKPTDDLPPNHPLIQREQLDLRLRGLGPYDEHQPLLGERL